MQRREAGSHAEQRTLSRQDENGAPTTTRQAGAPICPALLSGLPSGGLAIANADSDRNTTTHDRNGVRGNLPRREGFGRGKPQPLGRNAHWRRADTQIKENGK